MTRKSLLFLPVALAGFALSFWKVADPDVFWHLMAGKLMLEQGGLITRNTFSALFPGHPYQNNEWLFQVMLAGCYRLWGWAGVAAFKIAAVLALGGVVYATILSRTARPLLAASGATLALAIVQNRLTERPHLLSYLFLALVVLLVARGDSGARRLWLLPPLFALWANIHPEVVFGLLYLGLALAGEAVNALVRRTSVAPALRRWLPVTLACLAATLLNPWGGHLLTLPFSILKHDTSVLEFSFSDFGSFPSFWVFLALTLVLVAGARRRRDWAEIVPALVLGVLAARMQRVIPLFIVVATPLASGIAAEISARGGAGRRVQVEVLGCLGAYAALLWALAFELPGLYVWGVGLHEAIYPAGAADVLLAEPWRGHLYNPYREGGYLIYRLSPRLGVFIDGRGAGAYPRDFVNRLLYSYRPADFKKIMSDYDIQIALLDLHDANPGFNRTG